jgi:hypothetical protein
MRFMVMVRSSEQIELGEPASRELAEDMMRYNEELAKAGVLLAGDGLLPSSRGAARVRFEGTQTTVVDGPFTEAKELIAGYTVIQVKSREEAVEWARRFPNPHAEDCEIEIRQLYELEDLGSGDAVERFREMGVGGAQ